MDPTLTSGDIARLSEQLRDIRGIDGVPWWPPAPGWWLLLAALVLIAMAIYHWRAILRLRVPIPGITLGSWRWDAAHSLRDLRRRARSPDQDAKQTAGELSELLRRIAMARLGRDACAGLAGPDWLDWLTRNDPAGFPWSERGILLLEMPYAPPGGSVGNELLVLIDAAQTWVTVSDSDKKKGTIFSRLRRDRGGRDATSRGSTREGARA